MRPTWIQASNTVHNQRPDNIVHSISEIFNTLRHLDVSIGEMIKHYGSGVYLIFFLILFAETGLVVTPFLPGDTLLFAAGIFATPDKRALDLWLLLPVLTLAPLVGDTVNFHIGKWVGPHLFRNEKSKIFKKSYLDRTHEFFEKYGTKTIIVARWVPIIRTFAPFVAGMSQMRYRDFITKSFIGAFLWVWVCTLAGYFFGNLPFVKNNFELAMLGMVLVTFTPVLLEVLKHRRQAKRQAAIKASVVAE